MGLREWKRTEQNRVNDAENSDVGADTQRQGENRNDHKAGILGQCPPGKANVSKEQAHLPPSVVLDRARVVAVLLVESDVRRRSGVSRVGTFSSFLTT